MWQTEPTSLTVLHRLKDKAGHGIEPQLGERLARHSLTIDTCLRQIWLSADRIDSQCLPGSGIEIYAGRRAYSFLLQTVTGLNSSVPGETNVQGQFRCAWKRWRQTARTAADRDTDRLMQKLFDDAREVRSKHLQNIGGHSYGSLARKLLALPQDAKVLVVGGGRFAASLLPFFTAWDTGVWHSRLHPGTAELGAAQTFAAHEQARAASWATDIVLTTAADDELDSVWLEHARKRNIRRILHLGRRQAEPGIWAQLESATAFMTLDHVFALRSRQTSLRDLRVMHARLACEKRAHSRYRPDVELAPLPAHA